MRSASFFKTYRLNIPWGIVLPMSALSLLLSIAYVTTMARYTASQSIDFLLIHTASDGEIFSRMACVLPLACAVFVRVIVKSRIQRASVYCQLRYYRQNRWFKGYLRCEYEFAVLYIVSYTTFLCMGSSFFTSLSLYDFLEEVAVVSLAFGSKAILLYSLMQWAEMYCTLTLSSVLSVLVTAVWIVVDTYVYCVSTLQCSVVCAVVMLGFFVFLNHKLRGGIYR